MFFTADLTTLKGNSDQLSRRADQLHLPPTNKSVLFDGMLYLILSTDLRIIKQ